MNHSQNRVSILTYHSIDDSGSVLSVSPEIFRQQMAHLAKEGFEVLTLYEAARRIGAKESFGPKSTVITFDDGLKSVHQNARPVLQEYRFPATIFVVTGYCGGYNNWPGQPGYAPEMALLDWTELTELVGAGFEIGAHTLTHPFLPALSQAELEQELAESQAQIKKILGLEADCFAYPYGIYNDRIRETCRKYYRVAVTTVLDEASVDSDPLALERLDTYYLRNLSLFRQLGTAPLRTYMTARRSGRQLKAIAGRVTGHRMN